MVDPIDSLFNIPESQLDPFSTLKPSNYLETMAIPRAPKTNQHQLVNYFIKFYRQVIRPGHYFLWYDHNQLCKYWLPVMTDSSIALRHAVVAFSALVYSMKVARTARQFAFFYYANALKELQQLLNGLLSFEECNIAIATTLQLSSFDVPSLRRNI